MKDKILKQRPDPGDIEGLCCYCPFEMKDGVLKVITGLKYVSFDKEENCVGEFWHEGKELKHRFYDG